MQFVTQHIDYNFHTELLRLALMGVFTTMKSGSMLFLIGIFTILIYGWGVNADSEKLDERTIRRIEWSPDSTRVAISDSTATIEVWDVNSGEHLFDLTGQEGYA
jgi:WD40 repeat protein